MEKSPFYFLLPVKNRRQHPLLKASWLAGDTHSLVSEYSVIFPIPAQDRLTADAFLDEGQHGDPVAC
jgi:hypothetical protein